ncbi:helix-turn-helix domain-containing protein [Microbulbifer mangrovi]|uniref:helix-turn-helix domain-containing protein n=1 Tax=Microbulbifer mangrovi TaxID=927787 RepID=UPI0009907B68|nr:helix-turn-helix domain-containing protein [Microbulbifer mangrovi]
MQDRHLFDEALALMRNNLSEPLQTGELAAFLNISVKKLERIFSRRRGVLPARFYRELRLQQARELLFESGLSIDEIGQQCGFRSASHFSRCFREYCGRSPREERMLGERETVTTDRFRLKPSASEFFRVESNL